MTVCYEPFASSPGVASKMRRQRSRDTAPELALRRRLHGLGLRYRVDHAPLPDQRRRRADIVFTRAKVAVFVDGCFWHCCPEHGTQPKVNGSYWGPKLEKNRERDHDTDDALAAAGWQVIRVWEHEDPDEAAHRVAAAVLGAHIPRST